MIAQKQIDDRMRRLKDKDLKNYKDMENSETPQNSMRAPKRQ